MTSCPPTQMSGPCGPWRTRSRLYKPRPERSSSCDCNTRHRCVSLMVVAPGKWLRALYGRGTNPHGSGRVLLSNDPEGTPMTRNLLLRYLDVRQAPLGRVAEGEALHAELCAAAPRFYGNLAADAAAHATHR